jgi:RNA polymerase sigma-70 factor (ECF subfamily)
MGSRRGGFISVEPIIIDGTAEESGNASADAEIPDATVVACILNGDQAAFEILVRRHQAALFRRARWMGLDGDTAADMVQDTLIKAYQNLGSCREPNRFGFWAGQILRNRCLDFLKSAARRNVPLPVFLPSNHGNPELEQERSALRARLNAALASLPDEQREAFLMKHAEGFSYEEMADLADASVSAMKMRVHRAMEALRDQLDASSVDSGKVTR